MIILLIQISMTMTCILYSCKNDRKRLSLKESLKRMTDLSCWTAACFYLTKLQQIVRVVPSFTKILVIYFFRQIQYVYFLSLRYVIFYFIVLKRKTNNKLPSFSSSTPLTQRRLRLYL